MPDPTIRILLADDQSIMLEGLEALIAHEPRFLVCGKASNGIEAVRMARELMPNVVLMDISMPGMDGIDATRAIKKYGKKKVQVLVLSMYGQADFAREVLDAGASGYLLKNTGRLELTQAIETVAKGGRYVSEEILAIMEESLRRAAKRPDGDFLALTKREKQVVKLIAAERTTQEIADRLNLSPATVETHRKNIFHKLDCRNAAGLVKYAVERGWDLEDGR
jgi:two-component system, NarL family, nitrate/nitrite response regulator NarL